MYEGDIGSSNDAVDGTFLRIEGEGDENGRHVFSELPELSNVDFVAG